MKFDIIEAQNQNREGNALLWPPENTVQNEQKNLRSLVHYGTVTKCLKYLRKINVLRLEK